RAARQPALLLLLSGKLFEIRHDDVGVHRNARLQSHVSRAAELLADDRRDPESGAAAAMMFRQPRAEETAAAHRVPERARRAPLAFPLRKMRSNLARKKGAKRRAQLFDLRRSPGGSRHQPTSRITDSKRSSSGRSLSRGADGRPNTARVTPLSR